MLDGQALVELEAVAGSLEAVAQFDILDARGVEIFVKTTAGGKDRAADGTAGTPECRGPVAGCLVHVVVQEIAVLGEKIGGSGTVVVGANQGGQIRVFGKAAAHLGNGVGIYHYIGVQKEQQIAAGLPGSLVAGPGRTRKTGQFHDLDSGLAGDLGAVQVVVGDDDNFIRWGGGGCQGRQTLAKSGRPPVHGDDGGDGNHV